MGKCQTVLPICAGGAGTIKTRKPTQCVKLSPLYSHVVTLADGVRVIGVGGGDGPLLPPYNLYTQPPYFL
jgi:hypothetical protein